MSVYEQNIVLSANQKQKAMKHIKCMHAVIGCKNRLSLFTVKQTNTKAMNMKQNKLEPNTHGKGMNPTCP